ncbi:hypothetical protein CH340_07990 [Rhodoplanes serenus]|nr:hypothetical protein CH340_07990 [Rhodoplanes serenus]
MMSYRDMTFCGFWRDCALASSCARALTDEVRKSATKWWGDLPGEPPIAQYSERPPCHRNIEDAA